MSDANTILLEVDGAKFDEGIAGGTITPGMACNFTSTGTVVKFAGTIGANVPVMIAYEDGLQGRPVTTDYATGERVFLVQPKTGNKVAVLLKDGQTIDKGEGLVREAASGLYIAAGGAEVEVDFVALEALSPSGANALIAARRI